MTADWPNPELIAAELRTREATARGRYGNAPQSTWPEPRKGEPKRHYGSRRKSEPDSE